MIDVASDVASLLRADDSLMDQVSGRVYADRVPDDADAPFVVARVVQATPWFMIAGSEHTDVTIQVDLLGQPDTESHLLGTLTQVSDLLRGLHGTVGDVTGATYTAVTSLSAANFYDVLYSPARPRWVVTATLVVRNS